MRTEDREMLERLALGGISFSAQLEDPAGVETVPLKAEQVLAYLADPRAFSARHFGLSGEDYETWLELGGQALCGASTASGARCRNPVSGHIQLSPAQWKARHGGLCAVHGGASAPKARAETSECWTHALAKPPRTHRPARKL
jgi:hypothetical protein